MKSYSLVLLAPALFTICGCSPTSETANTTTSTAPNALVTPVSLEAKQRLEQADTLDGKSDHVIGKCYVCSLGMDGKEKFAVKVGDYTAHLCSKGCQEHFSKSSEDVILKTDIPKKDK